MRRVLCLCILLLSLSACNLTSAESVTPTPDPTETPIDTPTFEQTIQQTIQPPFNEILTPQNTPTPIPNTFDTAPTLAITAEGVAPVGARNAATVAPTSPSAPTLTPAPGEVIFPQTFPDSYTTTSLRVGQTLLVNYTITLDNPGIGRIYFIVLDPNGTEVDRWFITETDDDTREIPVETAGAYEIRVAFSDLRGNYSVSFGFR